MSQVKIPPLRGFDTAPEFFIDGLATIQFMGVNTRYVLYKQAFDARSCPIRKVEFTAVMATGGLFSIVRQLTGYMIEHHLAPPRHEATR